MMIEPVIEIFGGFQGDLVTKLRETILEEFLKTDYQGMIFTYMMAFDQPSDWEYLNHVKQIFEPYKTEFYYVELIAPQAIRLQRNATENRLKNKPSKRDICVSNQRLIADDQAYRCVSFEGEIPFDNYLRVDNSNMSPQCAAKLIKESFHL